LTFAFWVAELVRRTVGGLFARRITESGADTLLGTDLVVSAVPVGHTLWAQEWLTVSVGVANRSLLAVLVHNARGARDKLAKSVLATFLIRRAIRVRAAAFFQTRNCDVACFGQADLD
jgi:hypothetical protein